MNGASEAIADATPESAAIEDVFPAYYDRIARVIARVIHDPARAEELAVDVFLKWSRAAGAKGANTPAWLHTAAVRMALDELRRRNRRTRLERLLHPLRPNPTPADLHEASQQAERVRHILSRLNRRQAELLLLRSEGFSYEELAAAVGLHASSVGTLLARAQNTFRKEYVEHYGTAEPIE